MKILGTAVLTALLTIPTETAQATHDEKCLHRDDFRTVARSALSLTPMSRWQVHQLFEMTGHVVGESEIEETRIYRGCGEDSRAWIQYELDSENIYRVISTAYTWRYFGDGLTTLHPA